jgi:protein-S-isoprenylcysteine O-methyltransferase Ste14
MKKIRIPPLLLTGILALLMWLLSTVTWIIPMPESIRLISASIPLAVGAVFTLGGVMAFRVARTTVDPRTPEKASALVTSGVYRYSRNPMYVAFALFLLAWAIYLAAPWSLGGVAGFVLFMDRLQIPAEEQALESLFGDDFRRYRERVRRWL